MLSAESCEDDPANYGPLDTAVISERDYERLKQFALSTAARD